MYIIYCLYFDDNTIYVGMTGNLRKRLIYHKRGKNKSTKNKNIKNVLEIERCGNRVQARIREKYWKSGAGRKKLKYYSGMEQSGSSRGS